MQMSTLGGTLYLTVFVFLDILSPKDPLFSKQNKKQKQKNKKQNQKKTRLTQRPFFFAMFASLNAPYIKNRGLTPFVCFIW